MHLGTFCIVMLGMLKSYKYSNQQRSKVYVYFYNFEYIKQIKNIKELLDRIQFIKRENKIVTKFTN